MTCPRCQTENPPQAKFCLECAAPLVARCASCGTQLGEFAEGVRHGAEALRLATEETTGASPVIAHGCLGLLYLTKGDLKAGVLLLERGLALCRATGDRDWARWTAAGLGHAYALVGRFAEGRALLEEALREDLRTGASNAYADHLVRSSPHYS